MGGAEEDAAGPRKRRMMRMVGHRIGRCDEENHNENNVPRQLRRRTTNQEGRRGGLHTKVGSKEDDA